MSGTELVAHFRRAVANMWMSDPVEGISEAKYVQLYWNLASALGEIEQVRLDTFHCPLKRAAAEELDYSLSSSSILSVRR